MIPKYLNVDGMLSGTGIRDAVEGGCVDPAGLKISSSFITDLREWLIRYHDAHYSGFSNNAVVSQLDSEGVVLAGRLASELPGAKVGYFSSALAVVLKHVI